MAEVNQAAGKEWTPKSLNGKAVAPERPPTMKFANGKVAIFGGVNRLTGSYALVGESVTLGELMSTRMAGPPALVKLETSFSKTMSFVDGKHVSGNDLELLSMGSVVAKFHASK